MFRHLHCIRLLQRLLDTLTRLRLSSYSLLRAGLPTLLLLLRMPHRGLAWLVPTRFLSSAPEQLPVDQQCPPGQRSSTISASTLPRALFRRRLETLPMHVGDTSPSSTLYSSASPPGQKSTFGDPCAESSELEKDGIFAGPTSNSPIPEGRDLKCMLKDEGNERKGSYRHLNISEAVPGLVAVTSDEYERYDRGFITCVPGSWQPIRAFVFIEDLSEIGFSGQNS
ncbi:hypothetical protein M413DRAFT_264658 [Hebeloma cylindrosporum]|uniref:Uncharacterized protein n=1 Tax=Hebeloma cylindrosporum TaxID=76867 RepID=A0A0C3CSH5_HEBCY|nr:hypothetical protein M413DRAFT_264658 [Hebeloma cylindrosporum h7]